MAKIDLAAEERIFILFRVPAPCGGGNRKAILSRRNTKANWEREERRWAGNLHFVYEWLLDESCRKSYDICVSMAGVIACRLLSAKEARS